MSKEKWFVVIACAAMAVLVLFTAPAKALHIPVGEDVVFTTWCDDVDDISAVSDLYVTSIAEGNALWAKFLEEGKCFVIPVYFSGVVVRLVRIDTVVDGEAIEILEVLSYGVTVYVGFMHRGDPATPKGDKI